MFTNQYPQECQLVSLLPRKKAFKFFFGQGVNFSMRQVSEYRADKIKTRAF